MAACRAMARWWHGSWQGQGTSCLTADSLETHRGVAQARRITAKADARCLKKKAKSR